jgi:phosphate butyryltransferase
MSTMNIIVCGVGGQGILRAGELLSLAALYGGHDVKMNVTHHDEPHGASIVCQVRWGERVSSPSIPRGSADAIIAFELLESVRYLGDARPGCDVFVNDRRILPPTADGTGQYPENIEILITQHAGVFHPVQAASVTEDEHLHGAVLLGAFAASASLPSEAWTKAIQDWAEGDPEPYLAAFEKGRDFGRSTVELHERPLPERAATPRSLGVRSFDQMLQRVRDLPKRRVAIAGGQNLAALHAGIECVELGLGTPVYVGPIEDIKKLSRQHYPEFDIDAVEIVDARDEISTAEKAVAIVKSGHADILLKGGVNTPVLMRAVLSGKTGLRAGSLLSDTFVFEYPDEDGVRLIMITDGGVTLQPTIQQKVEILKNAVVVAHALGNADPRVALLAASETINPNVAATMDAAVITKMNRTGLIGGCIVEGPIALDVAVNRKAAAIKGTQSDVAGQADILVTASIDTANALAKSTTYFAGYRLSHVIVGGTAPILIASRSDTSDAKLLSVALGSLMARYFEEQRSSAA